MFYSCALSGDTTVFMHLVCMALLTHGNPSTSTGRGPRPPGPPVVPWAANTKLLFGVLLSLGSVQYKAGAGLQRGTVGYQAQARALCPRARREATQGVAKPALGAAEGAQLGLVWTTVPPRRTF